MRSVAARAGEWEATDAKARGSRPRVFDPVANRVAAAGERLLRLADGVRPVDAKAAVEIQREAHGLMRAARAIEIAVKRQRPRMSEPRKARPV